MYLTFQRSIAGVSIQFSILVLKRILQIQGSNVWKSQNFASQVCLLFRSAPRSPEQSFKASHCLSDLGVEMLEGVCVCGEWTVNEYAFKNQISGVSLPSEG